MAVMHYSINIKTQIDSQSNEPAQPGTEKKNMIKTVKSLWPLEDHGIVKESCWHKMSAK